jgi:Tol biopolymer transport system component
MMQADGSTPINLTDHGEPDGVPSWSPAFIRTLITSASWGQVKANST